MMLYKTKFKTKILFAYAVFLSILLLALGIAFYYYNAVEIEESTQKNMLNLSSKISNQLDDAVKDLDLYAVEIAANYNIIKALEDISIIKSPDRDENVLKISDSILEIVSIKHLANKMIRRANVFDADGNFITSESFYGKSSNSRSSNDIVKKFNPTRGERLLISSRNDGDSINSEKVFSLLKAINNPIEIIGYVEIQQDMEKIRSICDVTINTDFTITIFDQSASLVYTNNNRGLELVKIYPGMKKAIDDKPYGVLVSENNDIMGVYFNSYYTKWSVLLTKDRDALLEPLRIIGKLTILVGVLIILLSIFIFSMLAKRLTNPLLELKDYIEKTNADNLEEPLPINNENNEIESLNRAFQRMLIRLNGAIEKEVQYRSLHIKAQFDSLQAQMNPHFLFNMLTMIINIGKKAKQQGIVDICRKLAQMLRYSSDSSNFYSTFRDEIQHTQNYLSLMKEKYESRLKYSIEADNSILDLKIPKLIIQPLVENSIQHGFSDEDEQLSIRVKAGVKENMWSIEITDDGVGFNPDTIKQIYDKMLLYREEVFKRQINNEMTIGNIGILNTYTRLCLFSGKSLIFELKNNDSGGVCIFISSSIYRDGGVNV